MFWCILAEKGKSPNCLHPNLSNRQALIKHVFEMNHKADSQSLFLAVTAYKCITKLLAKSIMVFLPYFLGPTQTAFIQGRNTGENIILA